VNSISRGLLMAALLCGTCLGCVSSPVHYVQKRPDGGVIAMPSAAPEYVAQAEKMMHEHLPQGYVMDPLQVVPVGEPHRVVSGVGFFREPRWQQDHEVLLTFHAPLPVAGPPPGMPPLPAGAGVAAGPAPTQVAFPPVPQGEPIPVGN
jgi:hypothetical protein